MAIVIALWLIVLLTVIGGSHARNVRLDAQLTSSYLARKEARMLLESGLSHAILELFVVDVEQRWQFDGSRYPVKLEGGEVLIEIQNAAGLIDLNAASRDTFSSLFRATGMPEDEVDSLVAAILDWRDADDLVRVNGAEDTDYKLDGFDYGTPDTQFRALEELQYVRGMTASLFDQIHPFLTIYSGRSGSDVNIMPEELKDFLTQAEGDMNPLEAAEDWYEEEEFDSTVVGGGELEQSGGKVFHISIRTADSSITVAELSVVVDISGEAGKAITFRRWNETPRKVVEDSV